MQIKRFEAKNMTEALRQIKRELGAEAVILSAKDLRRENRLLGISRKIGVEVTAAVDEDAAGLRFMPPGAAKDVSAPSALEKAGRKVPYQALLHTICDKVKLKGRTLEAAGPGTAVQAGLPPLSPPRGAEDRQVTYASPATEARDGGMGRYLFKTGLRVGSLVLEKPFSNRVALIGNAGVGKTTSIANLAAHYRCIHKEKVGLLTLDRRSIGGFERLQIYADGMDLPLEAVRCPEALPRALERLRSCRLILIDTPAVDPGDSEGAALLRSQFDALGEVTTLLTVSAESRAADLQETAARCEDLRPGGIVITKTDLTRSYDDMVNFLCREGLAVYYFSSGRRVPLDFTAATIEGLAERFLQNVPASVPADRCGEPGGAPIRPVGDGPETTRYLANKSSDIFHRPGCKWIRLISEAHIVEFDSFADALNHRFKPCRYCNPQHITITGMLSRESAAQ